MDLTEQDITTTGNKQQNEIKNMQDSSTGAHPDQKDFISSPTYKPPGYPDFGNMWSQPPQALPGPENHPFFEWIARGARMDPEILSNEHQSQSLAPTAVSLPSTVPPVMPIGIQPNAVHPFLPSPSVAMEPVTPQLKVTSAIPRPSSSHTTPGLSSSPTEPSPSSVRAITPSTNIAATTKSLQSDKEREEPPAQPKDAITATADRGGQPACTSTYMRLVNNSQDASAEQTPDIITGQVWHSGDGNWRRHQWVKEGSMDVP